MLFPRAHPWTQRQKRLIASATVLTVILGCALIYGYERYYRGPSAAALYGTWQDMTPAIDSITYYRFKPDGTFDLMADSMGEVFVVVTGTWYAGWTVHILVLSGRLGRTDAATRVVHR